MALMFVVIRYKNGLLHVHIVFTSARWAFQRRPGRFCLAFHLQPLLTGFPSSFHVTFDEPPARGADLDDIRPLLEQHDGHADGSQDPWHGAVHLVCPVCSLSARCYLTWPFASLGGKKRIALPRHFHSGCGPRVQHRKRLGRARGAAGQQCRGLARRLQ